jgi:hypothetical protein
MSHLAGAPNAHCHTPTDRLEFALTVCHRGVYEVSQGKIRDPALPGEARAEDWLDSWKEIAAHFGRDTRTVQRWEKKEGLPVHRHLHSEAGTVYAFRTELDKWWRERRAKVEEDERESNFVSHRKFRRLMPVAIVLLGVFALLLSLDVGGWRGRLFKAKFPSIKSLAVLPLQNLSGDPAQEYFADSLNE